MNAPVRIQLSRKKGWRKPENTVVVARPSKWGNPWHVSRDSLLQRWVMKADHEASSERFVHKELAVAAAVRRFSAWSWRLRDDALRELAGKNLACWCPLDQPCHADVLLELANDCNCGDGSHHHCEQDKCDGVWCPERGCCDGPGMHQSPYAPDESKEARET